VVAVVEVTPAEVVALAGYHYLQFPLSMAVHTQSQLALEDQQPILAEQALLHTTTQFMPQLVVVEAPPPQVLYLVVEVGAVDAQVQRGFQGIFGQQ
jgi:hypothetical protein